MSDEVSWSATAGSIEFRYAVLYDSNPTIGEETTVTLVDADGNVETRTHIAVEPDDWDDDGDDDVPPVNPWFTPEQHAKFLEDGGTFRVSLRTEEA